jgi:hypothetical protein
LGHSLVLRHKTFIRGYFTLFLTMAPWRPWYRLRWLATFAAYQGRQDFFWPRLFILDTKLQSKNVKS